MDTRDGHRKRLRDRALKFGYNSLYDYELLELILCSVIARRDVKGLAKLLLKRAGSLKKVFYISKEELLAIDGVGEGVVSMLMCVRELVVRANKDDVRSNPVILNWMDMLRYIKSCIAHHAHETVLVLYLDAGHFLIEDEIHSVGTVNRSVMYAREIVKKALSVNASYIIISHNHPAGNLKPSGADIDLTRQLSDACKAVDIKLIDHILLTDDGFYSFHNEGIIS